MTARGDAWRALIGPHAVKKAAEVAATAPDFDAGELAALAVLFRAAPPANWDQGLGEC